jgi:hypothetical protein
MCFLCLCTCVHNCAFVDATPSSLRWDKSDHCVHTMNFFTFHGTLSCDIAFFQVLHISKMTTQMNFRLIFHFLHGYRTLAILVCSKALNSQSWQY